VDVHLPVPTSPQAFRLSTPPSLERRRLRAQSSSLERPSEAGAIHDNYVRNSHNLRAACQAAPSISRTMAPLTAPRFMATSA
jgi:hypothetical protein